MRRISLIDGGQPPGQVVAVVITALDNEKTILAPRCTSGAAAFATSDWRNRSVSSLTNSRPGEAARVVQPVSSRSAISARRRKRWRCRLRRVPMLRSF